mgnify:CR=1 FL=1
MAFPSARAAVFHISMTQENHPTISRYTVRELKRLGAVPLPTTKSMKTELANLSAEKERLLVKYKAARSEVQEYETVKQNVDALLTVAKEQEQQRRHELE